MFFIDIRIWKLFFSLALWYFQPERRSRSIFEVRLNWWGFHLSEELRATLPLKKELGWQLHLPFIHLTNGFWQVTKGDMVKVERVVTGHIFKWEIGQNRI